VPYAYRIGKFEISRDMVTKANAAGSLGITLGDMSLYGGNGPTKPATGVTWFEAARFVNWLNTSTGSTPAYKFNGGSFELWTPTDAGYDANNRYRNTLARYFLPSVHEWYKAAYYDPSSDNYYNFATGSDTQPAAVFGGTAVGTAVFDLPVAAGPADITNAGGLSPFGTMAQGGNVWEWEETDFDLVNDAGSIRALRGGRWNYNAANGYLSALGRGDFTATSDDAGIGLRVASIVPEPNALFVFGLASLTLVTRCRGHQPYPRR
jgi:formylglycine-generating enzyme required for sulfatase activity